MVSINKNIKKQLQLKDSWPEVENIIETLCEEGFQAVVAGGAVRDALLKKVPKDIDLATSATAEEVLKIFSKAKGEFKKYGVVFIPLKTRETLEITSFRKEASYKDGRRPSSISYSSMEEDAKRRDFTINALFYDAQKEEVIDWTGGLKDLETKTLRAVGKAQERFNEDHLRALRALRLAHQLDFKIDEETKTAIPFFAQKMKLLSRERILEELVKMFSMGKIGLALESLKQYGVLQVVFPDLKDSLESEDWEKSFDFWNRDFSFCKEQAFFWTVIGLPFFYPDSKSFPQFLKALLVSSFNIKKSLFYLKAVQTLTTDQSSFTEKLQALEGHKKPVFELTDFWLRSQNLKTDSLKKILQEFNKRDQNGKLPTPLLRGADLEQFYPDLPKEKFSSVLKQAFEYQMEHPQTEKSEILKNIIKY